MRSPFPGMDPYIETCHLWDDFHHDFISDLKSAIAAQLPKRYVVRAGERSYVTLVAKNGQDEFRMQANVTVARKPDAETSNGQQTATAVLDATDDSAPITMLALVKEEFREGFLEIREAYGDWQVVTAIEVLSPSNRRFGSEGWFEYLRKRQACLSGSVNFVEIDLLRGGRRLPMEDDWPASPYYFLSCWKDNAPRCAVWPASFKKALPLLVIPLLPPDGDLSIPAQPLVDAIFARSQYDIDIDYHQPARPVLSQEDRSWLEERLKEPR